MTSSRQLAAAHPVDWLFATTNRVSGFPGDADVLLDQAMLLEFRMLPLLASCGAPCVTMPFDARPVCSWAEAIEAYDDTWSMLKDKRYQDISLLLSQLDRQRFNATWSKTVAEAKLGVADATREALSRFQVPEKVIKYIKADLLCVLIEQSYIPPDGRLLQFYRNLYLVYQLGHFPCGWAEGDYPFGHMLYF